MTFHDRGKKKKKQNKTEQTNVTHFPTGIAIRQPSNNAAARSVESDIFYALIRLPARSKTYLKQVRNQGVLTRPKWTELTKCIFY